MRIAPIQYNNYNPQFKAKLKTTGNDDRLDKKSLAIGQKWAERIGGPKDVIEVNFIKPNVFDYETFRVSSRARSLAQESFYEPSLITVKADFDGFVVKERYQGFNEDEGLFFALTDMETAYKSIDK